MTRMEQAREAAALESGGSPSWAECIRRGDDDGCIEVRIALRASEMERDRFVAWLLQKALHADGGIEMAVLEMAADALARDQHHKETNDGEVS